MKKCFLILALISFTTRALAYDFSAVCETGQTLYYQISDSSAFEIAVVAPDLSSGYPAWLTHDKPTGDLVIPSIVEHDGNSYTVVSLLERAFLNCAELTSVVVPNTVTFIGERAFSYNSELTSVILPSRLSVIEGLTFASCLSLSSITLPDSLTTIKGKAFQFCESLPSITFPNTLLSIAKDAFYQCTGLSGQLVLPSSLQSLGSLCFYGCSGLSGILTLPESLISMGEGCFSQCSGLTGVNFPENLNSISNYAFDSCASLSGDLIIPNQCTSIGGGAFFGCSNLSSLTIGSSVSNIGHAAFMDCTGLESIHCNTPTLPYSEPIIQNIPYYEDHGVFENVPTDIPVYVNCLAIDQFQLSPHWSRFINMQGVFLGSPSLTVTVNNPEYGTAEVVSIPEDCDHLTATVRATPNLGHTFGYWKRNGAVVSFDLEYTFTLDHDCIMTACFDCSVTVYDSIGFPDHVIARKYNAENQVTNEYVSDFSYDHNGVLNRYLASDRNCYFSFIEYPSMPSSITVYFLGSHPETTETIHFTYEDDHQIRHCDHYLGNSYYDELNNHYDYYYTNHRLYQKDSKSFEDGEWMLWGRNRYAYENGNKTQIDSAYTGSYNNIRLSTVTTNIYDDAHWLQMTQTVSFNASGEITSRTKKIYTYTANNNTDTIITQTLSDGEWVNSGIAHYIYDFKNRVIEYQTGSWSSENAGFDITKKVLYDFNDETQKVTISFRKKSNGEWTWDVFSGQSLFNNSQLYEWQRQLASYSSSQVNQFEISMHYNTIEQEFPILSEWYYEITDDNGNVTYQHLEYQSDTTINNDKAKVIVRTNQIYDKKGQIEITHEYIMERNGKAYWWNKELQEFTTLYDYLAEEGDEWEIMVGAESFVVHVDSVGIFEYQGDVRKVLHVSVANSVFDGDIVVGLGHLTNFFPEKLMNKGNYVVGGLRCYWVGEALLYHHGDEDCDAVYNNYYSEDENNTSAFKVYPNPVTTYLFVITNNVITPHATPFLITTPLGQPLLSGTLSNQAINVSSLPPGLYFITIGNQTLKFVKQ